MVLDQRQQHQHADEGSCDCTNDVLSCHFCFMASLLSLFSVPAAGHFALIFVVVLGVGRLRCHSSGRARRSDRCGCSRNRTHNDGRRQAAAIGGAAVLYQQWHQQ